MDKRLVIALLAVAAVVYACGPRTRAAERTAQRHEASMTAAVIGKVDVTTAPVVTFLLEVTNQTGKVVELNFPSAQTHDFAVVDARGREVWRWSREQMFTQVLRNQTLSRGASVTYSETWPDAKAGTYTLVASANSSNHPVEERTIFTVR